MASYSSSLSRVPGMINLRIFLLWLWAATIIFHASLVRSDLAQDKAECTDKLLGLATCLTFVDGSSRAAAPTPDCCSGLENVVLKSARCLCILIKDRNDPGLGLNINVTRALILPTACHAPVDFAKCPKLLNLPPGSKDGQIFLQFAKDLGNSSATGTSTGASSSNSTASPAMGSRSSGSSSKGDTSGATGEKKWLTGAAGGGVWVAAPLLAVASLALGW